MSLSCSSAGLLSDQLDSEPPTFREHRDLGVAGPQRILRLQRRDRVRRMRATQGGGADFRQSDRADLAGRLEFHELADGVFDGNAFVPAMQIVQVDVFGPEIAQRLLADRADRFRPAVDHALAVATEQAAFARDHDVVRPPGEDFADQLLVGAESVERRGVEMCDSEIERPAQHLLGHLARLRWAIGMRQVHATKADRGDRVRT
jgi:hypothetical protein